MGDVERQKDDLIDRVETQLEQDLHEETLFTIRVLEMDVHGTVTAKVLTQLQLTREHSGIAELIAGLRERDGDRFAITGAANIIDGSFIG